MSQTRAEEEAQKQRSKIQSLQVDLDNSEAVQRDFVKLSQSLQVPSCSCQSCLSNCHSHFMYLLGPVSLVCQTVTVTSGTFLGLSVLFVKLSQFELDA